MGDRNLRACLARELFRRWQAEETDLLICGGAKAGLLIVMAAVIGRGRKLGLLTPCWPTYEALARTLKIKTVRFKSTADNWGVDFGSIATKLEPNDALVLSNPSNPTGRVYNNEGISALAEICRNKGIWLIVDESFSETVDSDVRWFDPLPTPRDQIIIVNSISKNFLAQGIRIGAICANQLLLKRLATAQLSLLSPPAQPMQELACRLIEDGILKRPDLTPIRAKVYKRLVDAGFPCHRGQGSYYLYPKISSIGRKLNILESKEGLYVLNGPIFSDPDPDRIRLCFFQDANELDQVVNAGVKMHRLAGVKMHHG